MELRHIRYFIAVAENMSISRAAQELLIAQPPLSRQIRDLEDELGADLFERTPQGLRITPEGNAFLQYARQIMDLAERSRIHVFEMAKGIQGTIDIASVEGHAPRLLSGWISSFKAGYSHVQYSIWNGSTDDVIYRVTNSLSEIGIITEPHNDEGLFSIPVYKEPWTAMIPSSDPLAQLPGDTISVLALKDRDLIIPSRESRLMEIRNWFPEENVDLKIRCRVAHMLNAYELTKQGVGIAIYPASDNHFSNDPDVTIKRIVDPEVSASYILVWDRARRLTHAAELFLRSVCDSMDIQMPA
jgi:DNA-binding transcriptional LysR family regulator